MTQIWIECIPILWLAASGLVDGYHVEVNGEVVADTPEPAYELCIEQKYTLVTVRVQGFNSAGAGEWSEPLEVSRVHNFDANDTGVADFKDFGFFIQDFGTCYQPNGITKGTEEECYR